MELQYIDWHLRPLLLPTTHRIMLERASSGKCFAMKNRMLIISVLIVSVIVSEEFYKWNCVRMRDVQLHDYAFDEKMICVSKKINTKPKFPRETLTYSIISSFSPIFLQFLLFNL
jgi:hypothetical protein